MALFKIFRGKEANLPKEKTDGYVYFTQDTNNLYVDHKDLSSQEIVRSLTGVGKNTANGGEIFNDYENNKAEGLNSHAEGTGTIASRASSHVQGQYNIEDTEQQYMHIVGNGTPEEPKNIHTLDWQGKAWYAGQVEAGVNTDETNSDYTLTTKNYVNTSIQNAKNAVAENITSSLSAHNTNTETTGDNHPDLRASIVRLIEILNAFFDSDDDTLNELSEIVSYIKNNKELIDQITINKVNVEDIADDLVTNWSDKVLSARQGVTLDQKIYNLSNQLTAFLGIDNDTRNQATSLINYANTNSNLLVGKLTTNNGETFNDYANNQATGAYSHAEGYKTKAQGYASHAEGNDGSTARGNYSHAENNNTIAHGEGSHAEGLETYSEGEYSHAEGYRTRSGGKYSHTEGYCTGGTGFAAHSEGGGTSSSDTSAANGDYSHAEGLGSKIPGYDANSTIDTTLRGYCQHVQGKYNIIDWGDSTNKSMSRYAHIVGNGTDNNNRSNCHTLDWNGNAWYSGSIDTTGIILTSPNKTKYKITVNDDGELISTKI